MTTTEVKSISVQRRGQGALRRYLLKRDKECPLTHISKPELLVASHIKPWAISTNEERVDPENVLLLARNYDALFDSFMISFDPGTGKLLKSRRLAKTELLMMGAREDAIIPVTSSSKVGYLKCHLEIMRRMDKKGM